MVHFVTTEKQRKSLTLLYGPLKKLDNNWVFAVPSLLSDLSMQPTLTFQCWTIEKHFSWVGGCYPVHEPVFMFNLSRLEGIFPCHLAVFKLLSRKAMS